MWLKAVWMQPCCGYRYAGWGGAVTAPLREPGHVGPSSVCPPVLVRVTISHLIAMSRRVVDWLVWVPTVEGTGPLSGMPLLSWRWGLLGRWGRAFPEASVPGTRPSASDSYAPMRRELTPLGGGLALAGRMCLCAPEALQLRRAAVVSRAAVSRTVAAQLWQVDQLAWHLWSLMESNFRPEEYSDVVDIIYNASTGCPYTFAQPPIGRYIFDWHLH